MDAKLKNLARKAWVFRCMALAIAILVVTGINGSLAAQGRGGRGGNASASESLPMDAAGHPDMSGYWELRYDSRAITPAVLTKEAMAKVAAMRDHDRLAIRWCANVGMPEVMSDGAIMDLRQGLKDIAIAPHDYTWLYDLVPNGLPEEVGNDLSDAAYLKRELQSVIPPPQN